jgi:hypothetical protein
MGFRSLRVINEDLVQRILVGIGISHSEHNNSLFNPRL